MGRKRWDCSIVMAAFHSLAYLFFFLARSKFVAGCIDRGWEKIFPSGIGGELAKEKSEIWDMGYGITLLLFMFFFFLAYS